MQAGLQQTHLQKEVQTSIYNLGNTTLLARCAANVKATCLNSLFQYIIARFTL